MTYLFHLLQPRQKLHITKNTIARLLNIPINLIIKVECWTHVIFIHRQDRGGQFISYRRFKEWQNAVASQIQKCQSLSQLNSLWIAMELDYHRYQQQYCDNYLQFVQQVWSNQKNQLGKKSGISLAANY